MSKVNELADWLEREDDQQRDDRARELRRLDAEVAQQVMIWRRDKHGIWHPSRIQEVITHGIILPHYTTNASAAEQVVVAMGERGWRCKIGYWPQITPHWDCRFIQCANEGVVFRGDGDSQSVVICRAALAAVKGSESDE